jgi:hypothetical protein
MLRSLGGIKPIHDTIIHYSNVFLVFFLNMYFVKILCEPLVNLALDKKE